MRGILWLTALLAGLYIAPAALSAQEVLPEGELGFVSAGLSGIRGVTVGPIESSQWPEQGYGTAASGELLDELVRLGASWVSITPFGRIWSLESTQIRWDFEAPYADNRAAVERMVAQAHARGLKVLLIPHLWVETGGWRGEIEPGTPEGWAAYQASFRKFILGWAEVAAQSGVDALSVGVECKSFSGRFGGFWTSLIGAVRARFPGLLTYSANWDEADNVLFWDQLDFIGINAFYPLAFKNGASYRDYLAGGQRARGLVESLVRVVKKPVVFTEVGYTTRRDAAIEPWTWPEDVVDVIVDPDEQARALSAMFAAFLGQPWFGGFFVWRYYANLDDLSQEDAWGFSPHAKPAEAVLRDAFRAPWAVDPPTAPFAKY